MGGFADDAPPGFFPKTSGAGAEGLAACSESLFQDRAVLSLGAPAMTGSLALQRLDHIAGNISNQQLGHASMLSYDSTPRNGAARADATHSAFGADLLRSSQAPRALPGSAP